MNFNKEGKGEFPLSREGITSTLSYSHQPRCHNSDHAATMAHLLGGMRLLIAEETLGQDEAEL